MEARLGRTNEGDGTILGSVDVSTQLNWYVSALGKAKINGEGFSPYALAGFTRGNLETCATVSGNTSCSNSEDTELSYGFGIETNRSNKMNFFAEWMHYSEGSGSTSNGSFENEITGFKVGIIQEY